MPVPIRPSCRPGPLPGLPQLLQLLAVALGVHAGPEPAVLVNAQLPRLRKAHERRTLEDAGVSRETAMRTVGHKSEAKYRRYNIRTDKDVRLGHAKRAAYLSAYDSEEGGPP